MQIVKFLNENAITAKNVVACMRAVNVTAKPIPSVSSTAFMFNYVQFGYSSNGWPPTDERLRECRALLLEELDGEWHVLSRSFKRFFNYKEYPATDEEFANAMAAGIVIASEKLDGSIITASYIRGKWRFFTRTTDADENFNPRTGKTYGEQVRDMCNLSELDKSLTYVFELCSEDTHVTRYSDTFLGDLMTHRDGIEMKTEKLSFTRDPACFLPRTFDEVMERLSTDVKAKSDFEGYVLSYTVNDVTHRIKVKSTTYLDSHKNKYKQLTLVEIFRKALVDGYAEAAAIAERTKDVTDVKLASQLRSANDAIARSVAYCNKYFAECYDASKGDRKVFSKHVATLKLPTILYEMFKRAENVTSSNVTGPAADIRAIDYDSTECIVARINAELADSFVKSMMSVPKV